VAALVGIVALNLACPPDMMPGPGPGLPTPGTNFSNAPLIDVSGGSLELSGSLGVNSIHIYDLGAAAVGDRLQVTIQAAGDSTLDPLVGFFRTGGELSDLNDDVDLDAGRLESVIDLTVRTATDHMFIAIAPSTFGSTSGAYEGLLQVTRGVPVSPPPTQILLLNFNGGAVSIPNVGNFNMPAFDAADIDPTYTGMTDGIKNVIVATVRENFEGTGLVVVTTDDPTQPAPDTFSTLNFGAFNPNAFGMAENVDHQNLVCCDDGIIFTDNFDDPFATRPSASGIGTAIGNVAAHEAGHLLGLEHTADITDLMDTTGTASTLLADQEFKTAILDDSIFPLGNQNSPLLLSEVIP
jgi:hypothetical protein